MLRTVVKKTLEQPLKLRIRNYSADTYDFLTQTVSFCNKNTKLPIDKKVSKELLVNLERLSLVDFVGETGIEVIEHAISFADELLDVNTDGVEPLITVLENEPLYLRKDVVESDVTVSKLLSHSNKTQEGYYKAPIGSVAFEPEININSEFNENVKYP